MSPFQATLAARSAPGTMTRRIGRTQPSTRAKAGTRRTPDGDPVHSFRALINELVTITRNTVEPRLEGVEPFQVTTRPTPLQAKILDHLGVSLTRSR